MSDGWQSLIGAELGQARQRHFPIAAYSEFMPPPRIGVKPSGLLEYETPFAEDDPFGWRISAGELQHEIAPGLPIITRQIIETIVALTTGRGAPRIGSNHLKENVFWPDILHGRVLAHERHIFLSPLSLAETQDDKGRVRWTLFGGSTDGPARGFWRSFFSGPDREIPEQDALQHIRAIIGAVFDVAMDELQDLKAAGFRIRPAGSFPGHGWWDEGPLPRWTENFRFSDSDPQLCRYLLTFTPFALLPEPIQRAYLAGSLHLLPSPASLVFWGSPLIHRLGQTLPFGEQVLLLHAIARHESRGIRVPQSGWLHHHRAGHAEHDPGLGAIHAGIRRTHRWQRVLRDDDDTAFAREDAVHVALFSDHPDDVRLYGKPMARNAQIWSNDFQQVLHGPTAGRAEIAAAVKRMSEGGSFGYRFYYPPMQVGNSVAFWHRPVLAFRDVRSGIARLIDCGLNGVFSAIADSDASRGRVELWPRLDAAQGNEKIPKSHRGAAIAETDISSSPLTFARTATRTFELRYWKTIGDLAEGRYRNKNTGDCVRDSVTQSHLPHPGPDLDLLADYLLAYYRRVALRAGMSDRVSVGDLPFRWETDFEFPWMGGWLENQDGQRAERDLITVIPGRDHREAVVMADHYDTAYMEDVYGDRAGVTGDGARLAAAGADDNHSATATLMRAAPIFCDLSRRGLLDCDIWLVHLTGEEFPADCLGARALTQRLIERNLILRGADGASRDLSGTIVRGVYVLDMIAHNNDAARDLFQIAPGTVAQSLWLAGQADAAARLWAAGTANWNRTPRRSSAGPGQRVPSGREMPPLARHLAPTGEIRLHNNPKSTLYNTDGQIFSDAGLPVVLFMENYDINREGYHDTHDTMANIDLDYGAAVAAIAIEAVARTASAKRASS